MKKLYYIFAIFILIISCKSPERSERDVFIDYDYKVQAYSAGSLTYENLRYSEYYHNSKLIRRTGKEDCTQFYYDSTGKLIETRWGRTCDYGLRNIRIFDSLDNHIGYFTTTDSIVNLDAVDFDQIFFYDLDNQLIKERSDKRKDIYGKEFEIWKHYYYVEDRIDEEVTLYNFDTLWFGKYYYDPSKNLIKIHRTRNQAYETELFRYNESNYLVEEEIISTANPVTAEVSFSAGNNVRKYQYDSTGFNSSTTIFNHNGEAQSKTVYLKIENK